MFFFKFALDEDYEPVNEINKLLKTLENQLKLLPTENIHNSVLAQGRMICEAMTELLLKKQPFNNPKEPKTFFNVYQTLYEKNIIPKECYEFLDLIRRYGNEAVHGTNVSDKLVLSFLNAFNNFIQWFDTYYFQNYQKKFQIEKCCELIYSLTYDETNKKLILIETDENNLIIDYELKINESKTKQEIKKITKEIENLEEGIITDKITENYNIEYNPSFEEKIKEEFNPNDEIEKLKEELKIKEEKHQKEIEELNRSKDEILKKLDEDRALLEKCLILLEESNEREKRMETKIDDLHSKIDSIANQIKTIQSLTERQIKNAQSSEEIERIIQTYIDECINNIMNYSHNFTENQNYRIEKTKLIYSIGEEGWDKLCEKSKTFLITSKVMYNHLITMHDIIDYSGICVLVTKALEVEIHKRFFTDFLDYLNENYGDNYSEYHTALLYRNKEPLFEDKFTMGNIAFVMCHFESKYDNSKQKKNNKSKLMEYCRARIFSEYNDDEIEKLLTKYASSIEEVREKYRNPSAHTDEIKRVDAEKCFNLVLDIEKLLKKMLDSFDN